MNELLAERAAFGHMHDGLERVGIDRCQRFHGEAIRRVEEDLLRVSKPGTRERELAITAALDPAGQDERELWKRGGRGQSLQRRPHERSERQQSQAS